MAPSQPHPDDVARRFGLGGARKNWQRVEGGLSNRLWRLDTDVGSFAIKQMIAGTDKPDFQLSLNASYEVESAAIAQGVAAPRPVSPLPGSGCLASIPCDNGDESWVRVHEWVDGAAVDHRVLDPDSARQLAKLLASIHNLERAHTPEPVAHAGAGAVRWEPLINRANENGSIWGDECESLLPVVIRLEARVQSPESGRAVWGHRDLDDKNTLITPHGTLVVLDWDAAGPVSARQDLTTLLLDWSNARTGEPRESIVAAIVEGYAEQSEYPERLDPSGWISAQLEWLAFNLQRALGDLGEPAIQIGVAELRFFFDHLHRIEASLDGWLASWTPG